MLAIYFNDDAGESYQSAVDKLSGFHVEIVDHSHGPTITAEVVRVDNDSDDFRAVLVRQVEDGRAFGPVFSVIAETITVL